MSISERGADRVIRFPVLSGYDLGKEKVVLEREAFAWAKREQERYFPHPQKANYRNLRASHDGYNHHQSLFVDNLEQPRMVLVRHYWPSQNKVLYRELCNYEELKKELPGVVDRFLNNGIYAYFDALKRAPSPG